MKEKLIRDELHLIPHPEYPNMVLRKVENIMEHIRFLVEKIYEEELEFEKSE
jgi:hypothetical protein